MTDWELHEHLGYLPDDPYPLDDETENDDSDGEMMTGAE